MLVNRRTALKQVLVVSAGLALLPSCLRKPSPASISLKNIAVDAEGENMLAALADTLIPATATPGAKDVKAHLFALTMVDDCMKKEDQQKFLTGMKAFSDLCQKKNGHSFEKSSPAEREALLKELEAADANKDAAAAFYRTAKELTIYGYTTSEYYLTKVQVYELVPGRFHGSVPVKPASKRTA
ncbi:gluconate 2-dehydrogenase subunit 3 family protein [Chitinophaga filiformis]|uniref:Gluconate 2-dehydrogenase subunit 3 n=1 Tax=Chitinophaga filiformis TaxID=104663 RepID=A0A1G7NIB8_CHIFI|nr:gluconate 2-dehydrogenase subunit 3 family protein [Chitinophaga filiformis]SDF73671.1 Gluconate 2-dehydrogenase subunit 3 [Chitinophaga filiformis]